MAYKLNQLDLQLIAELQKDGRASLTDVARALGVSHTTVRTRLNRVLEEDFIRINAWFNALRLGTVTTALVSIKTSPGKEEDVGCTLVNYSEVRYAGVSLDEYQVHIEVVVLSNQALYDFIQQHVVTIPGVVDVKSEIIFKVLKTGYQWRPTIDWIASSGIVEPNNVDEKQEVEEEAIPGNGEDDI